MIKSIIFSSIFHILIILIVIFNIDNEQHKKPKKTKEIKVNIIEEKVKIIKKKKKIKSGKKVKKKKIVKNKKPKSKPKAKKKIKKIEKKKEIKKAIPKKTTINKKPINKKEKPKKEPKKEVKKPIIHNIREYKGVDEFGISGREKANLKFQITRCYQESKRGFERFNIDVSVNVQILPNGIIDYNNIVFTNQIELSKIDKNILQKITFSIAKTLKDCSPLRNLPEEKYDIWRKMNIKFKY
ncbi:hypothetical protein N9X24_00005 [Rickettsiales bacterium]|nr:hypothetical protein [Rickettsiales bacterium]